MQSLRRTTIRISRPYCFCCPLRHTQGLAVNSHVAQGTICSVLYCSIENPSRGERSSSLRKAPGFLSSPLGAMRINLGEYLSGQRSSCDGQSSRIPTGYFIPMDQEEKDVKKLIPLCSGSVRCHLSSDAGGVLI